MKNRKQRRSESKEIKKNAKHGGIDIPRMSYIALGFMSRWIKRKKLEIVEEEQITLKEVIIQLARVAKPYEKTVKETKERIKKINEQSD